MVEFKNYTDEQEIEPIDLIERIRKRELIPILETIQVLEKEINKRVYGTVVVMLAPYHNIIIRIRNDHFAFGYEINQSFLYEDIGMVIDDCIYKYQKEILSRYIKKGVKQ